MFRVSEAYRPRPIEFDGVTTLGDWRLKVYSIRYGPAPLDEPVYAIALPLVAAALPQPAVAPGRPGVGFLIRHQGRGVHYAVLAWWDSENELPLRIFVRPFDAREWRNARPGESICVWDLDVIHFERDAYVRYVLSEPAAPDTERYLEARMHSG